jgi:hypothetical protein
MKKILIILVSFLILFSNLSAQDSLIINDGNSLFIPSGASICADYIIVNTGGSFIAEDSNGVCSSATISGEGYVQIGDCTHGWIAETNQQYNMNVIGQLKFEDTVTFDELDAIGAFVGSECRGIASPISALDGKIFLTISSNQQSGETITFKAWKSSTCEELAVLESFEFVNQSEVGTLENPFVFNAGMVEMQYDFGAGYTWFSVNLKPGDMGINNVFSGLAAASNDRIIGQTSFAVYDGGTSQWIGSLLTMDSKQMYIMKLASSIRGR